jgi:hypothetical protein
MGEPIIVPAMLTPEMVLLLLPDGGFAFLKVDEVDVISGDEIHDMLLRVMGEEMADEVQAYVNAARSE